MHYYRGEAMSIYIVGSSKLQNALLAEYLAAETHLDTICCEFSKFESLNQSHQRKLALLECPCSVPESRWTRHFGQREDGGAEIPIACFNVGHEKSRYREAVKRGARGVFFDDDPPDILAKGIALILKGEIWLSRRLLVECLTKEPDSSGNVQYPAEGVTQREKEVLLMVAGGNSNDEISDQLCISSHTVKTHLYNIYKKIGVGNRLQAALWVSNYL
jgi:DNA-binding NarL/FixJ family response regulator